VDITGHKLTALFYCVKKQAQQLNCRADVGILLPLFLYFPIGDQNCKQGLRIPSHGQYLVKYEEKWERAVKRVAKKMKKGREMMKQTM
jgi:hypothetical protein